MNLKILKQYQIGYLIYILFILILFGLTFTSLVSHNFIFVPIILSWAVIFYQAFYELRKKRLVTEFFLIFATILGIIAKEEEAIAVVLIIMVIAKYFESLIEQRTKKALQSLIRLIPTEVTVLENKKEKILPIKDVVPGMLVLVKDGRRIPVDGVIVEGFAEINESALTGESMLQEKNKGFSVFAGTFIESGSIIIKVQKVKEETLFGKMTTLLTAAEQKKTKIAMFTDKFAFFFILFFLVFVLFIWIFTRNLNMIVTLLVFGSPLELILVTPLTVLSATVAAFLHGILVRGGVALEQLANIDVMVFDKTGTLTLGEPQVVNIQVINPNLTEKDIIQIVAIAEKRSDHILSKAIVKKAKEQNIEIPDPDFYSSTVGHGVEIIYKNQHYFLGNRHYIEAKEHANIKIPDIITTCKHEEGHSIFYLACEKNSNEKNCEKTLCGKICIADQIRPEAKKTIEDLKNSGIKEIVLLSGDRQEVTETIAKEIGITKAFGDVTPDKKLLFLEDLQKSGKKVSMVGDGINDAPALKQSNAGIAMGAMGMEPAIEAADIVLMTNEISKIYFIRRLSIRLLVVIKQNLVLGFFVTHALGVILALTGLVAPIEAALFHAVTDILILINSARLIKFN